MTRICEHCGKEWTSKNGQGTMCYDCRYVKVTCECCGKEFTALRTANRKFCSHHCSHIARTVNYGNMDRLNGAALVIIAGDIHRGKAIEWIANRNNWATPDLKSFISDNAQKIQKQLDLCKQNDYPKAIGHEHHDAYIKHIHEPALI